MTKTCTKCGEEKPLDAYAKRASGRLGVRADCKDCCSAAARARRAADPEKDRARSAAWRDHNQEKILTRLRQERLDAIEVHGGECADCGESDGLQLDHINGGGEEHRRQESQRTHVRRIARTGVPDPRLQVLCAACHKTKTAVEISVFQKQRVRVSA